MSNGKLTDEELLKILETSPQDTPSSTSYKNDVLDFINYYKFNQGPYKIDSTVLYVIYQHWSNNALNKKTFKIHMSRFFEATNNSKYLLLNIDPFIINNILQQLRKKQDKTKSKPWKKHFENFIDHYKLSSGTLYLSTIILFKLYKNWKGYKKGLGLNQFSNFLNLYFKHKIINQNKWFGVNKSIINHLTDEMINEIKNRRKNT